MADIILICGKLCSGKTTYADRLRKERHAVLLSLDEITLLLGQYLGDQHDAITERAQHYLYQKSVEIVETGIPVILDWGFWTKESRDFARQFYQARNIAREFHYIDISDAIWKARLDKRNRAVLAGETNAYFVDDNLIAKFDTRFEMPDREEIDVWVEEDNVL